MTVQFWDGKPLFINGKLAMHARCCCAVAPLPPGPCWDPVCADRNGNAPATVMLEVSGVGADSYAFLNGSFELPNNGSWPYLLCENSNLFYFLSEEERDPGNPCIPEGCLNGPGDVCFCSCGHYVAYYQNGTIGVLFNTSNTVCVNNGYKIKVKKTWDNQCAAIDVTFTATDIDWSYPWPVVNASNSPNLQVHLYTP